MSKYRLSYLEHGKFNDIKLDKLECLIDKNVTNIEVIDEFTTSFETLESLLDFLKRNNLVPSETFKLYITIDKRENGVVMNKKIYNGDKLLFKSDQELTKLSFIYRWIIDNKDNKEFMLPVVDNYIEKYQNAYNRITGSSNILGLFYGIKNILLSDIINNNDILKYNEAINDFINFEFYKIDKDRFNRDNVVIKKKDKDGKEMKSYRNIHDFVILMKSLDKKLVKIEEKEKFDYSDENIDEFLTQKDFDRTNNELLSDFDDKYKTFSSYWDGVDYNEALNKEDALETLNSYSKKLGLRE